MTNRISKYYDDYDKKIDENNLVTFEKWPLSSSPNLEQDSDVFQDSEEAGVALLQPLIMGPMGPMKIGNMPNMSDIFKLWVGHTKVVISKPLTQELEKVPGVEILNPISQYRFQIGIGQMFADEDVLDRIKKIIVDFSKSI